MSESRSDRAEPGIRFAGRESAGDSLPSDPDVERPEPAPAPRSRLEELIRRSVRAEVGIRFDELHRLIGRKTAELSMEVQATVQLVDYSETNLSAQLARMQEQIVAMLAVPTAVARNSGIELEAVVQTTELAANRIMEAAEAIDAWVRDAMRHNNGASLAGIGTVTSKINDIFEACSFQDLTSQRIRRAIERLQQVDTMLGDLNAATGRPAARPPSCEPWPQPAMLVTSGSDLLQVEIDRLMAF